MPASHQAIFVSATSQDLGGYRETVREALLSAGVWPETQEQFPPDYRDLISVLESKISKCGAMICLVGEAYGSAPTQAASPPRSYTQIEYDLGRDMGKQIYVLMTSESFVAELVTESEQQIELQRSHRAQLLRDHKCEFFGSKAELGLKVTQILLVPGFSGRPAIAVLPFENRSSDREQEFFADGIAEDLMMRLARSRIFPVIARSSSFAYKGSPVDVKTVSRDLGVRYVVGGSVRKDGSRVRISAHLTDAANGYEVWGDRYDRELGGIFNLQDEITGTIVGALEEVVGRLERQRVASSNPRNLDAWETVQRGLWHIFRYTRDDTQRARQLAMQAVELDAAFSEAFGLLAASHFIDLSYQWSESPADSLAAARRAAERSAELDPEAPLALTVLGLACAFQGESRRAIQTLTRAVEANPSFALAFYGLGVVRMMGRRPAEAVPMISRAIRLSPRDPMLHQFLQHLSQAHFIIGQFKEASVWAKRSLELRRDPRTYRILAASHGHLGNADEGRACIDALRRLDAGFTPEAPGFAEQPSLIESYLEGWRRAGWTG